jgi:hypothetical protein
VDPCSFLLAQTIVQVENEDLMTLTQESPGSDKGIVALEGAASSLYKALQATRETGTSWIFPSFNARVGYLKLTLRARSFCSRRRHACCHGETGRVSVV